MTNEKDNLEFLLSQYLDGQLDPQEMERLEDRLGSDLELRREFQRYAKLDEMLGELRSPPELAAVDFDAQRHEIMAALERKALLAERPRFNVIRMTFAGVGALAAAAVIVAGSWLIFHTPSGGSSPVARVEIVKPVSSSHGQAVASLAGPGLQDLNQAQVAVEYEQVPDNEFPLAAAERTPEAWDAPTGTVLMVGVSPRQPEQAANNMADLLLE